MKKLYFLMVLSGFLCFCGSQTKNIDKPTQGEWDFKLKKAWEIGQFGENVLNGIQGICVNKDGYLFLWDSEQSKVFVCDSRGTLLNQFGGKGEGPGEIMDKWATLLFLTDKYVVLHEVNTGRIHYFLHNGEFKTTKKILKKKYARSLKTFIDPDQFLFFLSEDTPGENENILGIYNLSNTNYEVITKMPGDSPLTVNDEKAGNITWQSPDVSVVTICAQFEGEKIFYGRNNEYAIKGVDIKTKQTISFSITGRKGREISKATKEKRFENLPIDKQLVKLLIEKCPDRTMFFNRLFIDKMGLLYVFIPDWEKDNSFEIDIFSPDGKYLYHSIIRIPDEYSRIRNLTFNQNDLYFSAEDVNGEIKLVKFNISSPTM